MNFKDINLKLNKSIKVIKINGKDVNVKQYLPAEDKNSILENTIQKADQGTILNTFALDIVFHVYLVVKYTDITFDGEDLNDIFKLYDILESNKVIDSVVAAVPEEEYKSLRESLMDLSYDYSNYRNSARAIIEQLTFFAPDAANKFKEVTENFDNEKFAQIIQLAEATGINNKIGQ